MNLLEQTKKLCKLYNIIPARSKGQNFLINEAVYEQIIEAANLSTKDLVLEVGPGLGFLTAKLAKQADQVVAVELDDKLARVLKTAIATEKVENVQVVNQSILDFNDGFERYKIVANLPYNITSVFLRKFISEVEHKPELMVLMLQKEVAERIVAKPGKLSLLAISVQFYAQAEIIATVPAADFWPAPEVASAIIRITVNKQLVKVDEKEFFRLVKFGFSAKRKMLKNNLASGYQLSQEEVVARLKQAGFNEKIRAQELSVEDWVRLLEYFK